jgi:hypothetical protein
VDELVDPLDARLRHIEAQVDWIKNYNDLGPIVDGINRIIRTVESLLP